MRLVVVGAGIGGSSIARRAMERGHDVTVVSDGDRPPASRAALCVVRPSWFRDGPRRECEASLAWYAEHGWLTSTVARVSTYRRDGVEQRAGFYSLDPRNPLVTRWIEGVWPDDCDPDWATVLCRGAYSPSSWKRAHGVTTIYRDYAEQRVVAHEDRPRNMLYAANHDGFTLRFGSSKGANDEVALDRQMRDEGKAATAGLLPADAPIERVFGVRLMPPSVDHAGLLVRLADRLWSFEGFGRIGYSLAPARALAAVEQIEKAS